MLKPCECLLGVCVISPQDFPAIVSGFGIRRDLPLWGKTNETRGPAGATDQRAAKRIRDGRFREVQSGLLYLTTFRGACETEKLRDWVSVLFNRTPNTPNVIF